MRSWRTGLCSRAVQLSVSSLSLAVAMAPFAAARVSRLAGAPSRHSRPVPKRCVTTQASSSDELYCKQEQLKDGSIMFTFTEEAPAEPKSAPQDTTSAGPSCLLHGLPLLIGVLQRLRCTLASSLFPDSRMAVALCTCVLSLTVIRLVSNTPQSHTASSQRSSGSSFAAPMPLCSSSTLVQSAVCP